MSEWKAKLDALVADVEAQNWKAVRPQPQPKDAVERIGLKPLDYGGSERDEIRKRVQIFKAHQERFRREREEYAAAALSRARPITKC